MSTPRKAGIQILYNNKDITNDISSCFDSLKYTDVATGEGDSLSLSINDKNEKWITSWMPKKLDKIEARIKPKNWNTDGESYTFKCGTFIIDDLSYDGWPISCTIEALSIPSSGNFKTTQRTKTWKSTTVSVIAKEIAKRASLGISYEANTIKIDSLEQSEKTDCEFLYELCKTYGLAMKIYNNKIVIYDEGKYENKAAVMTINKKNIDSFQYNTSLTGTYTGGTISYTNSEGDDISVKVGSGSRILKITEKADSYSDARLKAIGQVNEANKSMETMRISINNPSKKLIAAANVNIKGISSKVDGKYAIDKVDHSISGQGGYKVELELRKIQKRIQTVVVQTGKSSYKVGDIVYFKGGTHYYTSYKDAKGYKATAGKAKITIANGAGKAHPWHLIRTSDSTSNVYGWVDDGTFT